MKSQTGILRVSAVLLAFASRVAVAQPVVAILTPAPTTVVVPGQAVTLAVSATGSPVAYQWRLDGVNLPGATGASYVLPMAGAADRGSYRVVATGAGGTTTVDLGTLAIGPSDARLMNFSARGTVGTGSDAMIAGFVSRGDPSSTDKSMLFRGIGPGLGGMGGTSGGMLASPMLTLYDGESRPMGSNMGWGSAPTTATGSGASRVAAQMRPTTQAMMSAVGAFTSGMGPTDSALLMTGAHGAYTAVMSGLNNGNGIALVECYDADAAVGNAANTARLVNMSVRSRVGDGANALIAGFVIAAGPSGAPATVMIRAMGPALAGLGVDGAMTSPTMTLFDGTSKPIASNTGWSNGPRMATGGDVSTTRVGMGPALANTMSRLGAFPPAAGSADCALMATLPAGSYTVVVTGLPAAGGRATGGIVLCEVYEVR